jgi:vesicle-fusing ATPase
LLNAVEPKVVNGPEVLNKYVGQSEENIRALFKDAEEDQKKNGDSAQLHIVIFDEIDAICKQRGSSSSSTGVNDSIVNQLLTKIDGVNALNNILLIGMTNRKDLLDEALLRPGRLEVMIEVGLPDETGRTQILTIHTGKMSEASFLSRDVDLGALATRTKNYSGAEIEGLVKSAVSFALNRQVDMTDLSKEIDTDLIKVGVQDFEQALAEVKPAFGVNAEALESCAPYGLISYGPSHDKIVGLLQAMVRQISESERTSLLTCLLLGGPGVGKTALAASVALGSGFPMVRLVSPNDMVGFTETAKVSALQKAFEDAYKSPSAMLVLDDMERLLEYVHIGPRFSNHVLQSLLVLLKKPPPKGRKLLVIGTCSRPQVAAALGLDEEFTTQHTLPALSVSQGEVSAVLRHRQCFARDEEVEMAAQALSARLPVGEDGRVPIKRLLTLIELAQYGEEQMKASEKDRGRDPVLTLDQWSQCLTDYLAEFGPDH